MKLLMNYDYKNVSHPERVPFTSGHLLEEALKEYFDVVREGEADIVFNTVPYHPTHPFIKGPITFIYDNDSLHHNEADWIYYSTEKKLRFPNSSLLLDATIPDYKYYKSEFKYDVGFLGRQLVRERLKVLELLDPHFKMLNGSIELGKPSAKLLSQCKLLLIIDDYNEMGMNMNWIDRRIFTFGNIRPLLIPFNIDYLLIGTPEVDYITYTNHDELIEKARYYLNHMDKAEKIGQNLQVKLKEHSYHARAKEIYDKFNSIYNRN